MQIVRYTIELKKKDDEVDVRTMGDIHYGSPGCDEQMLIKNLQLIKRSPNMYVIGMGDYVENNTPFNDRGLKTFDLEQIIKSKAPLLSQQIKKIKELLEPIAPKTIGLHIGNHEDRTMTHDDFKCQITEPLGVNYLGDKAYIALDFTYRGKLIYQYKLLSAHSRFGGQQDGTVMMAAYRAYNEYEDFDAVLFGHTHFTFAVKKFRKFLDATVNPPELKQKKFYIVNTGTFLRGEMEDFDSYGDKKLGGGSREPGTATLTFQPYKGEMYAHT